MAGGTALAMWIGERITKNGIGNGISLLIFAGIISNLFNGIVTAAANVFNGGGMTAVGQLATILISTLVILLTTVIILVVVTFVDMAERRIPVMYAKRVVGRKMYGGQSTHIPLKLLSVGVLPLIFAYSFMAFPGTIFAMFGTSSGAYKWWSTYMNQTSFWYMLVCALLIIAFSYFYTSITFNPEDIAKNIQQQGGNIPGIRTGSKTVEFLKRTSNRLTLFAALFLAVLSTIPSLLTVWTEAQIPFGASSILIAVSVAIETVRQVESQMVMRNYKGFLG
jgi:preprotein translocase subunit SecY